MSEETADGFIERPDQTVTIVAGQTVTVTFVNSRVAPQPEPEEPEVLVGGEVTQPTPQPTGPGTQVRGVQITRAPAAAPARAQPRFTG